MSEGRMIVASIESSIFELRLHGWKPVRVRMHPDDVAAVTHDVLEIRNSSVSRIFGLPIVTDDLARPGKPVAEWNPLAVPGDTP